MRGRLPVLLLAVFAVAIAFAGSRGGDETPAARETADRIPAGAVRVPFVYSPEKEDLLAPLIERFNAERHQVGGHPVYVEGRSMSSGEAETKIRDGDLKPVAWSPASTFWGQLLEFEADRPLVPEAMPSLVRTPVVIAMWEPMARALGWPRKKLGFADFVRLARSGAGWGDFGHPEWGAFKLVHTNPDFSTSGLSAVVAEYFFATGKQEGLTERDVADPRARAIVRDLERAIVHYGENTLLIEEQMRKRGPGYASAVAMEETTLLSFNRKRDGQPPLVAIYPREGTFYSDNPYIVLDADWVTPEQRRGAEALQQYLVRALTPEVAAKEGFRPADVGTPPAAPVEEANGVDPAQPERVLTVPSSRVLARIKQSWREDRKPANVMLVLDVSGSMSEDRRLESAKRGVRAFLDEAVREDRIGLMTFSDRDEIRTVVPLGTLRDNRQEARVGGRPAHRLRRHRLLRRGDQGVRARASASRATGSASTRSCCSPTATTRTRTCSSPTSSSSSTRATPSTRCASSRSPTAPRRAVRARRSRTSPRCPAAASTWATPATSRRSTARSARTSEAR